MGPRAGVAVVAGVLGAALLAAGCTPGQAGRTGAAPAPSADSSVAGESSPAPSPGLANGVAPADPVVLIQHHSNPDVDLRPAVARAVLSGRAAAWPGGRVRLVAAPGTGARRHQVASARRAVARVAHDPGTVGIVPLAAVGPQVRVVSVGGVDPMADPSAYPLWTRAQRDLLLLPRPVTLTVVGDLMLARRVATAASGSAHPAPALQPLEDRLAAADLTVGNFESTLSRAGAPTQGSDSFGADPQVVGGLRRAGFDALGLANNHAGDFGPVALVQTVRRLRSAGIDTFGAGGSPGQAWEPAVVERRGVSFGFLGFNAIGETPEVAPGRPGAVSISMPPRTGPLDRAELDRFLAAVRRLDRRVDVVVVLPHWGTQYTNRPEPVQRDVARALVRAGADLVVGGHPHWVQGVELVAGVPVVHSLGNFVFDMDFMAETMRGVMLEAVFWGPELKAMDLVPYELDQRFAPRVEPRRDALDTLRLLWATSGPQFAPR